MPIPTIIGDLSTTASLNSPAGSENLSTTDDYLRAVQGIVKTVYNDQATINSLNTSISTVASSATPDLWTGTSGVINYTGVVTATGFATAPQAGARRVLILAAAASFTAGANMLIDGVVSFAGAAGDEVEVFAVTTTQFRLRPKRASGAALNVLVVDAVAMGYGTGAGGAVTQLTSKATAVTLNKPTGQITTSNVALAAAAKVVFVLNNTLVGVADVAYVCVLGGGGNYRVIISNMAVAGGSFGIELTNISAGSLSEAVVISYVLHKGAIS